ncbi:MAG: DnaA regulatory inactivator Hda [Gammaproteobacteria bacterium]
MNSSNGLPRQIPLRFGNFQQYDFDSFLPQDNERLFALLAQIATGQSQHHVYIWGPASTGKSHLLQAVCKKASESEMQVAYVPLDHIADFSPEMLHDLGTLDLVCIDALENVVAYRDWQQSLVWLYNELRDNRRSLLIAGRESPQTTRLELEDLRSRLGWDQVFQIRQVNDDIKKGIMKQHAANHAYELPEDVIDFLIHRVDRDMSSLISLLDKLDEASLAEKRKITIPFIKTIIG